MSTRTSEDHLEFSSMFAKRTRRVLTGLKKIRRKALVLLRDIIQPKLPQIQKATKGRVEMERSVVPTFGE
jgi:hypothetical protein